jgi:CMP-N-acetylneuraminic acid synthetase
MAELTTRGRERIARKNFAYVDSEGEGHLPIHDASHVRNAMARWNQTEFESLEAKQRARRKILRAAKKHDIEVSDDAKVATPAQSLRAAHTREGPRGGKKDMEAA